MRSTAEIMNVFQWGLCFGIGGKQPLNLTANGISFVENGSRMSQNGFISVPGVV